MDALADLVKGTEGFEEWQADLTPMSLDRLGEWFATQVEGRNRSEDEIQLIKQKLAFPVEIPAQELTTLSLSKAFDVGIYLAEVLISEFPTLKWTKFTKNKRYIDYGQPVLIGFKSTAMNPIRIVVVLAYGLIDKKQNGSRLRQIYDQWARGVDRGEKIKLAEPMVISAREV